MVRTAIKKSRSFLTEQLWTIRLEKVGKRRRQLIRFLRVISLAIKGWKEDDCLITATALTFYTVFSIVPILALIFAIAKGFGMEQELQKQLINMASGSHYADVLPDVFATVHNLLTTAKGGVIAGFGIILLLWSVMNLLINIENSFNKIWEVNRGRTWVRKLTDYLSIMMVGPIFVIVSAGLTVALQTKVGTFQWIGPLSSFFIKLLAWSMIVLVFTLIYVVLPNTKVQFKSAVLGGIVAMILFEVLSWAYVKFQVGANRLNAIYGGFAALPLFLIWVQYCWYVVLFGAEIAFSGQNVAHYEFEEDINKLSARYKKVLSLLIVNLVAKNWDQGKKPLSANTITSRLDLPLRLSRNLINDLVETGVFVEVKTDGDKEVAYMSAVPEGRLTVQFVLESIEKKGLNALPIEDHREMANIDKLMNELQHALDGKLGGTLMKDLVH